MTLMHFLIDSEAANSTRARLQEQMMLRWSLAVSRSWLSGMSGRMSLLSYVTSLRAIRVASSLLSVT